MTRQNSTEAMIGNFQMADIRRKRPTARRAVACGEISLGELAFTMLLDKKMPKGDPIAMAEIAGIQGAKNAALLLPLCHPLALEYVQVRCQPIRESFSIRVYCEASTEARTGVEMEALAGTSAALLTLYDLSKPIEPALQISAIRLLFKEGGKSGLWCHPEPMTSAEHELFRPKNNHQLKNIRAAVLTLSDRAHSGEYADLSGPILAERLIGLGAEISHTEILPDGIEPLASRLRDLSTQSIQLVLCTGGTGLGPRDLTLEALQTLDARHVPGLGEMFRSQSQHYTSLAWLSRAEAVLLNDMLVIALPGSPKAVAQGMDILGPILAHAMAMVAGEAHA
ncbi:molybdenum cofactor biosynthesis bifunctional protein [Arenimonas maotaiensis]|uniref:Molybdenum cofactor biosynthesis bifunctional protein n=2 Tax=Arenimonas maotaiensis TaxID=1446479 RepID=A0A917CCT3_9GAMM|nr:molybdenum cofactor biosynthesis bifunctional protein [Arenimonas maotaiensis]